MLMGQVRLVLHPSYHLSRGNAHNWPRRLRFAENRKPLENSTIQNLLLREVAISCMPFPILKPMHWQIPFWNNPIPPIPAEALKFYTNRTPARRLAKTRLMSALQTAQAVAPRLPISRKPHSGQIEIIGQLQRGQTSGVALEFPLTLSWSSML